MTEEEIQTLEKMLAFMRAKGLVEHYQLDLFDHLVKTIKTMRRNLENCHKLLSTYAWKLEWAEKFLRSAAAAGYKPKKKK